MNSAPSSKQENNSILWWRKSAVR